LVELDGDRVIDFQEKPEHPKSTLVSIACYGIPADTLDPEAVSRIQSVRRRLKPERLHSLPTSTRMRALELLEELHELLERQS
jgi:NDP-sugar pyrophosphorylase family protein